MNRPSRYCLGAALAIALAALAGAPAAAQAEPPILKLVADVPLPGGATRFDYQSLDAKSGRLFLSHMGDGELVVFDTRADKVEANLPGFPSVTGVLFVPELDRVFASVPGKREVAALDARSLAELARIPDGKFPDGLAYSPKTRKLFVSDESGGAETVIDAEANKRLGSIEMGGEVGNTQYDPGSGRIYACVQTRNQIVAIDPETQAIVERNDLAGAKHPHGFYIDAETGRAYITCEGNSKLLVFNLKARQVEDTFATSDGPDVLAYDRGLNLLYVACESGPVSIFSREKAGAKLSKRGDFDVGSNAHSVAVDSATHRAYFPLKSVNGAPVLRIMIPSDAAAGAK